MMQIGSHPRKFDVERIEESSAMARLKESGTRKCRSLIGEGVETMYDETRRGGSERNGIGSLSGRRRMLIRLEGQTNAYIVHQST